MSQNPKRERPFVGLEYRLIREWTVEAMEREVNAALADGWEFHGTTGVSNFESAYPDGTPDTSTAYTQAMTRTRKTNGEMRKRHLVGPDEWFDIGAPVRFVSDVFGPTDRIFNVVARVWADGPVYDLEGDAYSVDWTEVPHDRLKLA